VFFILGVMPMSSSSTTDPEIVLSRELDLEHTKVSECVEPMQASASPQPPECDALLKS
jgi:hypothetical protein